MRAPGRTPPDAKHALAQARLLHCAIELIRTQGVAAVTVSSLARILEVRPSVFYTHFDSIEECLAEAAAHVVANLVPIDAQLRANMDSLRIDERAEYLQDALDRWMKERPFVELALAARLDPSPFGKAVRPTLDALRDDIVGELRVLAGRCGVALDRMDEVDHVGDAIYSQWLWGLEMLVSNRCSDTHTVALMMANNMTGIAAHGLRHVLEPPAHELVRAQFSRDEIKTMRTRQELVHRELTAPGRPSDIERFGGSEPVTDACMTSICQHFIPAATRGQSAKVQYLIETRTRTLPRLLTIEDGRCTWETGEATGATARCTYTLSIKTLLECLSGVRSYANAFNAGDMRVEGDVLFGTEFERWFYLPGSIVDQRVG